MLGRAFVRPWLAYRTARACIVPKQGGSGKGETFRPERVVAAGCRALASMGNDDAPEAP